MKKLGFLALALCAAGVAGAVSVSWDQVQSPTIASDGTFSTSFTDGTDFTVALVFDSSVYNSAANASKVLRIGHSGTAAHDSTIGTYIDVSKGSNGGQVTHKANGTATALSDWNLRSGKNVLGITVDYDNAWDSGTRTIVYSVYLNGNKLGDFTHENVGGANVTASEDYGTFVHYRTGLRGAELYTAGEIVSGTDMIALLPEPTALALLALGVAGVALRRRVA